MYKYILLRGIINHIEYSLHLRIKNCLGEAVDKKCAGLVLISPSAYDTHSTETKGSHDIAVST